MCQQVLLIIDMQVASFKNGEKYQYQTIIQRINQLSEKIRTHSGQVIFIQHDGTVEEGLLPGTDGWEILPELIRKEADLVIRKTTNDAFYKTDLNKILNQLQPKQLVIAGWATDFCVDTTIRSAVSHEYNVVVASDCHTVSDRPHLKADRVIEHHNWIWQGLISPKKDVQVCAMNEICTTGFS